jgi:hypothetical protein
MFGQLLLNKNKITTVLAVIRAQPNQASNQGLRCGGRRTRTKRATRSKSLQCCSVRGHAQTLTGTLTSVVRTTPRPWYYALCRHRAPVLTWSAATWTNRRKNRDRKCGLSDLLLCHFTFVRTFASNAVCLSAFTSLSIIYTPTPGLDSRIHP